MSFWMQWLAAEQALKAALDLQELSPTLKESAAARHVFLGLLAFL